MNSFPLYHKNILSLLIVGVFVVCTAYILMISTQYSYAQINDIQDGDVIQAQGSNDIYIVKKINNKAFKRLILNPHIFNAYPNLDWNNVKQVNQDTFHTFILSDLITPQNSDDIYRIFPSSDMGVKAKIELTRQQIQEAGVDIDSIYTVNDNEYSEMSYPSIDPITTLSELRQGNLFVSNMTVMSIDNIQDGDLIRTNTAPNIYIAKKINNEMYKREIVNPRIFQAYGHLQFQNVKTISDTDLNQFTTSNLIQQVYPDGVPVNTGVYNVFSYQGSGLKRLIQTPDTYCSLPPSAIYSINEMEASEGFYFTGPPITQIQECQEATTPETPQTGVYDRGIPNVIDQDDSLPQVTFSLMVSSQSQITVQWSSVVGADMYDVRYRRSGQTQWTMVTTNSVTYQAQQLSPNTQYEFQVRGTTNTEDGPWSIPQTTTTNSNLIIPQPNIPVISQITETSMTISWTNVSNASLYDIRYRPAMASIWTVLTNQSSPALVNNLTPDTLYQFQVRGTTTTSQNIMGPWSSSAQAATTRPVSGGTGNPPPVTPPPTVTPSLPTLTRTTGVSVSSSTNTSITVSFNTQFGSTAYEVQYKDSTTYTSLTPDPITSPVVIPNLTPDTPYTIRVRAKACLLYTSPSPRD